MHYAEQTAMTNIMIRRLNTDDLEDLLKLLAVHTNMTDKRKTGFRRRLLLSRISSKPFGFVREDIFTGAIAQADEEQIIGTAFARRFPFGKSWVIGPVVVHSNHRSSGIATSMMNFTVELLKRKKAEHAILSVETRNIGARRFFERSGFKYLAPVFKDHDQARNYVQMLTLISGYLRASSKTQIYPPRRETSFSDQESKKSRTRTWNIMMRKL